MILNKLIKADVLKPGANVPKWLPDNCVYLTIMGSQAYGVSSDDSDIDVYGICIPPKSIIFPHTVGYIEGFGPRPEKFDVWQQHHLMHADKEYDLNVYNIVKFMGLLADNNPNIIDSVFTPRRCVLHATEVGNHIRDNRLKFLHRGCVPKFKGYAYKQMHKIRTKNNSSNPKRAASVEAYGYDVKFAYHVVRLALECIQILRTRELNLEQDREILKSIRRGEWTLDDIEKWFEDKEVIISELESKSTLPAKVDWRPLQVLLEECLEMHYGSIDEVVKTVSEYERMIRRVRDIVS